MEKITNQRALRAEFWRQNPHLSRRRITNYSGNGKMYPTDVRVTWCDWLDAMNRAGIVSDELADRATLSRD